MNRLRVVLDSNVYISGLVYGGIPAQLLVAAVQALFILCVSGAIQDEVTSALKNKFEWPEDKINAGCEPLWEVSQYITSASTLHIVTADPDDDRILECAVNGQADIIVTGDEHLLSLNKLPQQPPISHIRIMTPRAFLDLLAAQA